MVPMKKSRYPLIFSLILTMFTLYVVLDTFIIPTAQTPVQTAVAETAENEASDSIYVTSEVKNKATEADKTVATDNEIIDPGESEPVSTTTDAPETQENTDVSGTTAIPEASSVSETAEAPETVDITEIAEIPGAIEIAEDTDTIETLFDEDSEYYYADENYSIAINTYREYDTDIYVAEVVLSDPDYLKTALADNMYGKNIKDKTSEIAKSVNAVFAVNGDFYGAQETGYVIRNGVLYRSTAKKDQEDLVILEDGSFLIINESKVTAAELMNMGAVQVLSFGPGLIEDGEIAVTEADEVGKAKTSNPRTAIGVISEGHYIFVVSDGRTDESEGLSLYELAEFMQNLGVETAYNLDGGGSSTMYFAGEIINNPTTSGNKTKERSVSDIVYIG